MPTWTICFDQVVIGRVDRFQRQSAYAPPEALSGSASRLIRGTTTIGEAVLYSYTFLNHHVGAASNSFRLTHDCLEPFEECVLIDYGCGPGAALMALAEVEYARNRRPLTVHYLGLETPNSTTPPIAADLFDCVRHQGLISPASTRTLAHFTPDYTPFYQWPRSAAGCPVFFALCYVLAHPFFHPPVLPNQPDPVTYVREAVQACRQHYDHPVQIIYANALRNDQISFGVHAGWARLLGGLGLQRNVRTLGFDQRRFESGQINGRAGRAAWQQLTYREPVRTERMFAACDHQILP